MTAALEGAGVVLARTLLVQDALIDGRLVRILPAREDLLSGRAHVARWPSARRGDARVKTFVD